MTPEEQRIAIAESLGYSIGAKAANGIVRVLRHGTFCTCFAGKRIQKPTLLDALHKGCFPKWLSDLNAMHEAEKVLTDAKMSVYEREIATLCCKLAMQDGPAYKMWHATAAQRAEAFLRTLGLWKDKS